MAKIIKTNDQIQALNDVNEKLKLIGQINKSNNESGFCSITITIGKSRTTMPVEESTARDYLQTYRKQLVKDVNLLIKKYHIELDDNDINTLHNDNIQTTNLFIDKNENQEY